MSRILISYSYVDQPRAEQLRSELQSRGYDVSTDADLLPGQGGINPLLQLIENADAMIVLLSPAALESQWLMREIEFGLQRRKPIIPVLLEQMRLPDNLVNRQYVDATGEWQQALEKIVLALEASVGLRQIPQQAAAIPRPATAERKAFQQRLGMRLIILIVLLVIFGIVIIFPLALQPPAALENPSGTFSAQALTVVATTPATRIVLETDISGVPTSEGQFANDPFGNLSATEVALRVEGTLIAYRATESNELSPAEGAQVIGLLAEQFPSSSNDGIWMVLVGVLASVVGMGAMSVTMRGAWLLPNRRSTLLPLHASSSSQETKLPPLLEDFQIFISCSEADKQWIRALVDDMTALGYLVWWYAKDAPGLSFGREIQSAIYHTKVFVVVVSPDSMASKHVEEEIRWAEIYDRPVVPLVYRFVDTRDRLYGLAKRSAIDFSDEKTYKASIEQLTQAVDHYLKQRLAQSEGNEGEA
ncbi:MAG: toll/interleukin-1 receptor domain-containing protein [Burkholderiales bacterium]|nr:toll/interleukin-1 receptor domain-containing protein [Anaerolineae bacterium]